MRQSIAPTRQSHLSNSSSNPAAFKQLSEKKKEFEAILALEKASTQFLRRIEGIADDVDNITEAGIVYGRVLEQWPDMFRILNIFLSSREQTSTSDVDESAGERLVRIPIEELQTAERTA